MITLGNHRRYECQNGEQRNTRLSALCCDRTYRANFLAVAVVIRYQHFGHRGTAKVFLGSNAIRDGRILSCASMELQLLRTTRPGSSPAGMVAQSAPSFQHGIRHTLVGKACNVLDEPPIYTQRSGARTRRHSGSFGDLRPERRPSSPAAALFSPIGPYSAANKTRGRETCGHLVVRNYPSWGW
jgi:hypothetical protein